MISPLINSIVIAGFGFFMGIVLQIAVRVMPERSTLSSSINLSWRSLVDEALKKSEESREAVRTAPPQYWMGALSFYGLIVMLILVLRYSPLEMDWLVFLVTFFIGFWLFQRIFDQAKAGKISSQSSSSNDSPPEAPASGD